MNELEIYYAVNKSGMGCVFEEKPNRNTMLEVWEGQHDGSLTMVVARMESFGFVLPDITWNDEPVKIKLSLSYEE